MKVPTNQAALLPYTTKQAEKIALMRGRLSTLDRVLKVGPRLMSFIAYSHSMATQTALKVSKATAASQASAVKAQSNFSKDMAKLLKSSGTLPCPVL